MKIKDFFIVIAVFCATVVPATAIVLGGLIFISSCEVVPPSKVKVYTIRWENGPKMGETATWLTEEELSLGQYKFDPFTKTRFKVISIPPGSKVRANKAGTDKTFIITVNQYVAEGDTIMGPDGVYYIPKIPK